MKMDQGQFLEEFNKRVSEVRTSVSVQPGYDKWQVGYVTGLERALKIAIAVCNENKDIT
jgi:hypothetical protein